MWISHLFINIRTIMSVMINMNLNTKNILLLLIGVVSVLIIVSLAVAVSVIRSQLEPGVSSESESVLDSLGTVNNSEEVEISVLERMQRMYAEGDAETTPEQLERMEQMNQQTPDLTDAEQEALLERMRIMRDAE